MVHIISTSEIESQTDGSIGDKLYESHEDLEFDIFGIQMNINHNPIYEEKVDVGPIKQRSAGKW